MTDVLASAKYAVLCTTVFLAPACAGAGGQTTAPLPVVALTDCGPAPKAGRILLERQLTQQARLLQAGPLVYPAELHASGIAGAVRVALVIDTLGRAVPSSLRVLSADNIAFEQSTRQTILQSRWVPGFVEGRPAAICTIMTVHFESD